MNEFTMSQDAKQPRKNHIKKQIVSVLNFLQKYPLLGYFLLVFGLIWLWEIPIYGLMDYWQGYIIFLILISPSSIGLVMTAITEGDAGIKQLIDRCTYFYFDFGLYLIALLISPMLFFITVYSIPGAAIAFQLPSLAFIWTYLSALLIGLFRAPIIEELGWRGFALPRLQERYGPLLGTLILGSLWALWHLPSWFLTSRAVIGNSFLETLIPFLKYEGSILGSAFIYTWIFNRSNGSVFLSMLLHASINETFAIFPSAFFPTLFQPNTYTHLFSQIGFLPLAILAIILTRGRLGYDYYQKGNDYKTFKKPEMLLRLNAFLFSKRASAHFDLGFYLLVKKEQLERAEKEIRHAIAIDSKNENYLLALACVLRLRGKDLEAIENSQNVLKLNPRKELAYSIIGEIFHEKLNQPEEAENAYRRAIEVNPQNYENYFQLGWLLLDLHRYAEAEALLLKTLDLNPKYEFAFYNLACIKSICRDSDSAFDYLQKAIENGFDREWAWNDKDLEWLHQDPRFTAIVGEKLGKE